MVTLKNFWWVAAIALVSLPSCLGKGYNSQNFSVWGVIQRNAQDSSQWWFMADDSVTFAPASATNIPSYYRAVAYVEWNSDIPQRDGYTFTVNFNNFEAIAVLPVTATGESYLRDSAPNDQMQFDGHFALQYITMVAHFNGSDGSKHKFFLLRDSLQTDPVRLLFRHSRGGDSDYQSMSTIMSFNLETLAERSVQDTVRLQLIYSERDSFDFTYRFQK